MKNIFKKVAIFLGVIALGFLAIFFTDTKKGEYEDLNLGAIPESEISALSPVLWIDFSDAATVTTVSGNVSQVNDKSASALNFTQGTAGNRPSYQSAVQNGLNVARFDGTNDRLVIGSNALGRNVSGLTVYVLQKWSASPTAARTSFSIATNGGVTRFALSGGISSDKSNAGGRRLDADGFASVNSANNVSTTSFFIQTGSVDYTNADIFQYIDKVLDGSNTSFQTSGSTSNTAALNGQIGSSVGASSQFYQGDVGEVLVFHSTHTTAQRRLVLQYLTSKWGLRKANSQVVIF